MVRVKTEEVIERACDREWIKRDDERIQLLSKEIRPNPGWFFPVRVMACRIFGLIFPHPGKMEDERRKK